MGRLYNIPTSSECNGGVDIAHSSAHRNTTEYTTEYNGGSLNVN